MIVVKDEKSERTGLKERISALEIQYQGFVKYCLEMIKAHSSLVECELKSDPSTPRELLKLVNTHSENLEKSVKSASNTLTPYINPAGDLTFDTFKTEIKSLLGSSSSYSQKLSKFNLIFANLEFYVTSTYAKTPGLASDQSQTSAKRSFKEDQGKLIKSLSKKLEEKEKELEKKQNQVEEVLTQLEKIKSLQAANVRQINSYSRPSSCADYLKPGSSNEKSTVKDIMKKIKYLEGLVRKLSGEAAEIKKSQIKGLEIGNQVDSLQFQTEKIEKVIVDIVTPRFVKDFKCSESGPLDRSSENEDFLNKEKIEMLENELKIVNGVLAHSKASLSYVEKENEDLKHEISYLKREDLKKNMSLISTDEFFYLKGKKQLEVCREESLGLKITYQNENLIRVLRKQLKEREKECYEKETALRVLQRKIKNSKAGDEDFWTRDLEVKFESSLGVEKIYDNEKTEVLEKNLRELNNLLGFTSKKLSLCENEKENLKKLLKSYEDCLSNKEDQLILLSHENDTNKYNLDKSDKIRSGLLAEISYLKETSQGIAVYFNESLLEYEKTVIDYNEKIKESIDIKLNYLQVVQAKVDSIRRSCSMKKYSWDFMSSKVSDKDKFIDSLKNSLRLAESTIFSQKSGKSEIELEKKRALDMNEMLKIEVIEKSKELESVKKQLNEAVFKRAENSDEKVSQLTRLLQRYQEQEDSLNKRIENQLELIQSLTENYENAKIQIQMFKEEISKHSKSDIVENLQSENRKLTEKTLDLQKRLIKIQEKKSSKETSKKNQYQFHLESFQKKNAELQEKLTQAQKDLSQEKINSIKLKEEFDKKIKDLSLRQMPALNISKLNNYK